MLEIQPILPSSPVVKAKKIKKDDEFPEKQQRRKQQQTERQDVIKPLQHIDEIV